MRRVSLLLTFFAFLSLVGSFIYYTSFITQGTLAIATLIALVFSLIFAKKFPLSLPSSTPPLARGGATPLFANSGITPLTSIALFFLGVTSLGALLFSLLQSPILTATRSLWLLFSPAHILFLTIAFLNTLLLFSRAPRLSALLGGLTATCTASFAALLFPLGFGFDPFLHRATISHIAEFGTISPKPFYYIGAYVLELWGNLLLHIPLFSLDTLLAPLGIGFLTWLSLRSRAFSPVLLALLPFSAFISTTPQALGFLWIFLIVISARLAFPVPYLFLFAASALFTHPIAGVPAVIFVIFYTFHHHFSSRVFLTGSLTLLGIFALPLLFLVQHFLLHTSLGFSLAAFSDFSRIPSLGFFHLFGNPLLDTVMFFGGNIFFITTALAILHLIIFLRKSSLISYPFLPFLLSSLVALGNFIILSLGFDFPFLISYERTDFALRLITVAWLFLLPVACDSVTQIVLAIRSRPTPYRSFFAYCALLLALLFSANAYVSYPRHDGYSRSAAFNVTPADQEIVHRIADDAQGEDYVVLSNQTLASMAVQEFGFFKYYHGTLFAYPIPTSSPLYALFLKMIETAPTLDTFTEARQLTGTSRVYFVIHDYWWEADQRIEEAKLLFPHSFTSSDGSVTVFSL